MITVAFDGAKLFDWQGDSDAVARINEETRRLAEAIAMTRESLWQTVLRQIHNNGGNLFTANEQAEMMVVTWGLLASPTQLPDRPGTFGDYVALWDFHFDIKIDPNDAIGFAVEVKGGFNSRLLN
jgi:hypothetical protein